METELGELRLRIERLEGIVARIGPRREDDGRTNLARVLDVLRARPGEWLTASEVAQRAGIDAGAVRMILYSNRELFTSVRVSPGRVRWQINPRQHFQEPIAAAPVMARAAEA